MVLHVIIVYSSDILMKFNMSQRVNKSVITSVSSLIIFSFIYLLRYPSLSVVVTESPYLSGHW